MVKTTKQRPRRLFYDDKANRYFYLINNKKKYIKVPQGISQKQIAKVNIQNILPIPVRRKAIRPRTSIKPITNAPIVSKLVPIAPIAQNLTDKKYDIYKPKDKDDLEKKITKLEEQLKAKDVAKEQQTGVYFPKVSVPKASSLNTGITTPPMTPKTSSFWDIFTGRNKPKNQDKTGQLTQPTKPKMTDKQFEASIIQYDKKKSGGVSVEDYPNYLLWQQGSKTYSKYEPPEYDRWISNIRFLPELETLPPEEKEDLNKKAREARNKLFKPITEGSNVMVMDDNKEGDKEGDKDKSNNIGLNRTGGSGEYENDDDGIFNDELQKIFSDKMNKFLPVIASDKMNTLLPLVNKDTKKFGWIQNTEPTGSMGRHWVAYYIDVPNMEVNYYDSLVENDGMPPKESMKWLKKIVDKIHPEYYLKFKYSTIRDQNPASKNCGYFALKFLMDRYRNVPFKSATCYDKVYDNYGEGEKTIKRFKKYL